ncbi:DUF4237 domain-containing protein [Kibdelosporangium aridum]|uniref:DUF4237 domain-containing protein n=1 Tax=Kibdelosporangium aridum TaxID=2030 RepID=A0A428ZR27_KIBAR|nr:TNT domain-containing protein [Kibdelosporangium aridum]RSM90441.1 DUF4237 domain-containing protein [Kibdelosporangium aridum]
MTWLRHLAIVVLTVAALVVPVTPAAAVTSTECSATHFQDDPRLGPEVLPDRGAVGRQLFGYQRTGHLSQQQFFDRYWDSAANWWRYPPADGYVIGPDGKPLIFRTKLVNGQLIDRYGSEFGQYLAPIGSPYASRSIPPQSLVSTPAAYCNYRAYRVTRSFTVDSGPIAPWFAQPGHGWQYQLKTEHVPGAPSPLNVKWLLDNGYLERVIGPPQGARYAPSALGADEEKFLLAVR